MIDPELYRTMSAEKKIEIVESIYVPHKQIERALARIRRCHQLKGMTAEARCMLIVGNTGAGKSTAMGMYAANFPRFRVDGIARVPVLKFEIPQNPTVKSLASSLLKALGDAAWWRGTQVVMTQRLIDLLGICGTELLLLDEFQHFAGLAARTTEVADWLKVLINTTKIPVVLLGIQGCEDVLSRNTQLKRRFSARTHLRAYHFDPFANAAAPAESASGDGDGGDDYDDDDGTDDVEQFLAILQAIDEQLPIPFLAGLADMEMAGRFYLASGGLVGFVMKIIRAAIEKVAFDECQFNQATLASAFREELGQSPMIRGNPFSKDFDPKLAAYPAPIEVTIPTMLPSSSKEPRSTPPDNHLSV